MKSQSLKRLFLSLLILLLWWLWPKNKPTENLSQPNTVSFSDDSSDSTKTNQDDESKPKIDSISFLNDVTTTDPYLSKESKELTYVDVYRMKRLYAQCNDVIYTVLDDPNYDPVARFEQNAAHFLKEHPTWPTRSQSQSVKRHAIKCEALLNQVQAMELPQENNIRPSTYLELRDQLTAFLTTMKPDSIQARRIAGVLKLINRWKELFQLVLELSKGDDKQNAIEINAVKAQLDQLRALQLELSNQYHDINNDSDLATQLSREVVLNSNKITELNEKLIDLKWVDLEARNMALDSFEVVNTELFNQLKSKNPDVFYEAQMALELNVNFRSQDFGYFPYKEIGQGIAKMPFTEYVSPGDVFKELLGINNDQLFGMVNNYATNLYHCELGADCGPNSQWVNYYCIEVTPFMNPLSCDLGLIDFYQQHLLNQNQWEDVQFVLNQIRGVYAE